MQVSNQKQQGGDEPAAREDVDLSFAAKLVNRGNQYYVSMHYRDIRFWDLAAGDEVLVKIVKVRRAKRPRHIGGED